MSDKAKGFVVLAIVALVWGVRLMGCGAEKPTGAPPPPAVGKTPMETIVDALVPTVAKVETLAEEKGKLKSVEQIRTEERNAAKAEAKLLQAELAEVKAKTAANLAVLETNILALKADIIGRDKKIAELEEALAVPADVRLAKVISENAAQKAFIEDPSFVRVEKSLMSQIKLWAKETGTSFNTLDYQASASVRQTLSIKEFIMLFANFRVEVEKGKMAAEKIVTTLEGY